jgi:glutamate N-acetyltransferase/amino-acid N-acetyltransferase
MASLHLLSPIGFRAAGVRAGIKTSGKPDVGMLLCDHPATAAAVFTTNKVVAAPVIVGRRNVAAGKLRGVVMNSGNANACTGKQGERDAMEMCTAAGAAVGCAASELLPSSTGIIGHLMPMQKVRAGIAAAAAGLGDSQEHAQAFMDAILTTDLKRKFAAAELKIGRQTVRLAGVCKGSGMIGPRMKLAGGPERTAPTSTARHATMLAYLTTDAIVPPATLRKLLGLAADASFNAVTVDDHASTNDTALLLASGGSGVRLDSSAAVAKFTAALQEVTQSLAYQIAADGEGATKVVKITVRRAASVADARAMARTMANSPLAKCAMHGNDPNWGRLVSAAGYAGAAFDPDRATLTLAGTVVFRSGRPVPFDAPAVSEKLKAAEVVVEMDCRLGKAAATVWTCDLSREYITINADYHT